MMRRTLAFSILVIGLATTAAAQQNATNQDARASAENIARQWEAAYNRGDTDAIGALFASDGVFVGPTGVLSGQKEIASVLQGRIKQGWTEERVKVGEAREVGNATWAVGDYTLIGSNEQAGKQVNGRYGFVATREDGTWRISMITAFFVQPQASAADRSAVEASEAEAEAGRSAPIPSTGEPK